MADARYAARGRGRRRPPPDAGGPKGAGKTTLAERLPGLLPDLTAEEALELTAIHSLAGALAGRRADRPAAVPRPAPRRRTASLLGGGTGRVRPGEVSRAHFGVLFLDEFPLFRADIDRSAAPAARERRGDDRPRRGVRDVPGPRRWS